MMMEILNYVVVGGACFCAGAIVGGLIVRNNYKLFVRREIDLKDLIMDATTTAPQKILHMRNRLGV